MIILLSNSVFSQEKTTEELLVGQYFDQLQERKRVPKELNILSKILKNRGQNKHFDSINLQRLDVKNTIPYYLCYGFYNLHNQRITSKSFAFFNEAYLLSKVNKNASYLKLCLLGFLELYSREIVQSNIQFKLYLDEFNSLIETKEDRAWSLYYTNFFNSTSIYRPEDYYYKSSKKLIPFLKKHHLSNALKIRFYEDIGLYYTRINMLDSAKWYYDKVLTFPDVPYTRNRKFYSCIHLVELFSKEKDFQSAKNFIDKAKNYYDKSDSIRSFFTIDRFKAIYFFEKIPKYDSAYHYLKASILKEHEIDYQRNSLLISELNVKLRTAEKENQLIVEQHRVQEEQKKKKNIILGSVTLFFLAGTLGFMVYKNIKRKQLIAEQEKELEAQKVEKVMKDQELNIINAMIEGQEKERKEIAEELHDNVASTLASANMQLDYFIKNKSRLDNPSEILSKAASLIGNAYHDVHDMAHKKNSGVIAQKGLVPAIEDLVKTISVGTTLQIDIVSSHIEERIPNGLEIMIFRTIQELLNNILKHANASEASIDISIYESIFSLIVEDNGIGFDQQKKFSGMGLKSIEQRIEAVEGQFNIDSFISRGTTVIIDIPLV
ncbi:MAG: sensor histidine kinase [Flavobacteriaceae bacterium]